jgi:hypothetical protein
LRRVGVYPNKSVDANGRERFHPLNIMAHYENVYPDWMAKYSANPIKSVKKFFFNYLKDLPQTLAIKPGVMHQII